MIRRLLVVAVLLAAPLRAQTADSVIRAAAAITAPELADYIGRLMADSLRDRATPSPGLEQAAQYIAAEFQRLGLKPDAVSPRGGPPMWIQRYAIPGQRRVHPAGSNLVLMARHVPHDRDPRQVDVKTDTKGTMVTLDFATAAYFAPEVGTQAILPPKRINFRHVANMLSIGSPVAVVAGRQSAASVRQLANQLRETAVLYIPAADVDAGVRRQIIATLYEASAGVMIVSTADSAGFAATHAAHRQVVPVIDDYLRKTMATRPRVGSWAVVVWAGAIQPFLATANVDIDRLRAEPVPVMRVLPATATTLRPEPEPLTAEMATAPNVVGVLKGADPQLRGEYVVFTAHLDNRRTRSPAVGATGADTVPAHDNSAGVAALLAIANAFSQPGARPRRSMLFLATSGGAEKEAWGANAFAYEATGFGEPRRKMVAAVTLDRLGRGTGDSIWINGLRDIELTPAPRWVVAEHAELDLRVIDGGTVVRPGADHFPFVRAVIPSLYLHVAETSLMRAVAPVPAFVDVGYAARVAQLAFYLAQSIASAEKPPRWSTEGRGQLGPVIAP